MAALSVFSVALLSLISLSACIFHSSAKSAKAYVYFAEKNPTQLDLCGVLNFQQIGQLGGVRITGTLKGLTPGKHGFHVHERGDIGNGCLDAGGHYNPLRQLHGGPNDLRRHVGDLGNIIANENGEVTLDETYDDLTLSGPHSIIGRAIVIHEGADDLGKGGDKGSMTTGNAGPRVACGVIAIAVSFGALSR
ncbi:unnamed protein product [Anisakis simplex]|uniref:Superoxide dismutase [Cu-Zn] n=1 Tax=Anisakis simplex TaxID=6269 RepID=A0A0M3JY85_ANISI|nr:unnamed protein product [Anisakis simplex]